MKKTILALAAFATVAVVFANRSVELSSLDNLSRVDQGSKLGVAFTGVNEHALQYLPVSATLRAEDAIAGVALGSQYTAVASR